MTHCDGGGAQGLRSLKKKVVRLVCGVRFVQARLRGLRFCDVCPPLTVPFVTVATFEGATGPYYSLPEP